MIMNFIKTIRAKKPSSPMSAFSMYLVLLLYYAFLFWYKDILPKNIALKHLNNLSFYPLTDWFSFFLSWGMLRGLMQRRDILLNVEVYSVPQAKKEDEFTSRKRIGSLGALAADPLDSLRLIVLTIFFVLLVVVLRLDDVPYACC